MFVHDSSLSFVEAEEADVAAVHRSLGSASAAPEGISPRPCNAYVCAIQRKGLTRVYVVLEHADRRGRWVFASPKGIPVGEAYLPLLKEGLAFATSLGFTMQEVNLSYGKAMREVVIRDIPVLRRPSATGPASADGAKDAPGDAKREAAPKENKEEPPPAEKREEKPSPKDESEATALADRLAAEKAAAERESRERFAELKARVDSLFAERKEQDAAMAAQEAALQGEIARLTAEKEEAGQEHAQATASLRSTVERLKGELEALGKGGSSAAASLRDEIAWLKAEKDKAGEETAREEERLRAEVDKLAAARDKGASAAAKRIESLTTRLADLATEQATAAKGNAARIKELEAEAERLTAEIASAEKKAAADIAALEAVIEKRAAEKEAARKLAVDRLVRLAAEVEVLVAEREAVEQVISRKGGGEMAGALARAEAEAATLRREIERLAAEKTLATQASTARVSTLQAEVTRLASQGEPPASARRGHGEQVKHEPEKPESVIAATGEAAAASEASTSVDWDDEVAAVVGEVLAEGQTDPFSFMGEGEEFVSFGAAGGGGDSGAGVGFSLDKGLETIEYDGPADVIEVHNSLNVVNITPAGHTPQPCGAYIVALKKRECFRVHVAWSLTADHSTLVYSPEKQPADAGECAKVVRDALAFVETVGFMMDTVRLNPDPDKRGRALAKIPVLRLKR
ncbi:hypothetical protein GeomeDRAFT_1595 [Geobacter metallireducens RCH3]|uniref:Uncharacterized protein n=1 Tax=Geobacter metallireducens (strain ATCC 53774 / DSM 7210 / GS-15) TaxID=269799 RepID=Q39XF1_GEOMG|nr:hypothetical protein [Geobacter metallireducens]ABB31073.1 hypothetical protein Gmet_0831 [Geobacter metallireducens GS-15]EHP86852.1 hypothetical protein GeomeDRAFT_1595 [Geobacter metallireducens RCH3]